MNESNVALAEAPANLPVDDDQGSGPDRRRLLIFVGGGAALVLLGLAAWFLFFSGSGSSSQNGLVVVRKAPPSAAAPKAVAPAPAATPFTDAIGRDPFEPIVAPAAPAASSGAAAGAGAGAAAGSSTGGSTASTTSVTVEMVKVTPTAATLKVDGKTYTASVGEVFATNFKLYGLFDAQCAGVLYGDQSVPLCVGDVRTLTK